MTHFIKRLSAMSVAVILLCVSAMAQNENDSSKSVTNFYKVRIDPNNISLTQGNTNGIVVTITPLDGYYLPTIYFGTQECEMGEQTVGDIFTVEYLRVGDSYLLTFKAREDIKIKESASTEVGFDAKMKPLDERSGKTTRTPSDILYITVYPR